MAGLTWQVGKQIENCAYFMCFLSIGGRSKRKTLAETLQPQNYDIYKPPSVIKEYAAPVRNSVPPKTYEWTNQQPPIGRQKPPHQIPVGPFGQPTNGADHCDSHAEPYSNLGWLNMAN